MHVSEILEVKSHLEKLKNEKKLISDWSLPNEDILTRRSAAIFFFSPVEDSCTEKIVKELKIYPGFNYRENAEMKLSVYKYRITFDKGFTLGKGYQVENKTIKETCLHN